jgi:putative spermidine/putrescine transport system substrate-binding protein
MVYDSARIPEPPKTISALLAWAKAHPGRFTYAAPPDFTGSVFVRHVCYSAAGGYQQFMGDFNPDLFAEKFPPCWQALKDIEPYLWRSGETYPENRTRMQDLFANGEVDFDMTYIPAEASSFIVQGKYPATARTFVFDEGTIANTHYLAIAYNSGRKAGALVAANFLLSPEAQYSKAEPSGWGDLPGLDLARLPVDWQNKFEALPRGPATLPAAALAVRRLPELQAGWLTAIESEWEAQILYGR